MKVTAKQAYVLDNLQRIIFTQICRKKRAMLDGVDYRPLLMSLGAKKLIRWNGVGRPVKIAEPEGIRAHMGRVCYPVAAE